MLKKIRYYYRYYSKDIWLNKCLIKYLGILK